MKILILGSTGLLGSALVKHFLIQGDHEIIPHSYSIGGKYVCDISNQNECNNFLDKIKPDLIINLIALTDVDLCEKDPNFCYRSNVVTAENVTLWLKKNNCLHFYFSTDQLYDSTYPSSESEIVVKNYYSFSKYCAEKIVSQTESLILRTNFFGKSLVAKRCSFSDWIYKTLVSNKPLFLFNDVFFSPLSINTLIEIIYRLININIHGTYNLGSSCGMSKFDFASLFAKGLKLGIDQLNSVSIKDNKKLVADRPKNMTMSSKKFEQTTAIDLPRLTDEIKRVIKDYE